MGVDLEAQWGVILLKTTHLAVVVLECPQSRLGFSSQSSSSWLVLLWGRPPRCNSGIFRAEIIHILSFHFWFWIFLREIPRKKNLFISCMILSLKKKLGFFPGFDQNLEQGQKIFVSPPGHTPHSNLCVQKAPKSACWLLRRSAFRLIVCSVGPRVPKWEYSSRGHETVVWQRYLWGVIARVYLSPLSESVCRLHKPNKHELYYSPSNCYIFVPKCVSFLLLSHLSE